MFFSPFIAGAAVMFSGSSFALPSPGIAPRSPVLDTVNMPVFNPNNRKVALRELNFDASTCSTQQQQFLTKAFGEALIMVDNVLNTGSKDSMPFKTYFDARQDGGGASMIGLNPGSSMYPVVEGVFKNIKKLITSQDEPLMVSCDESDQCPQGTLAWAKRMDMKLNFCPNFFGYKTIGRLATQLQRVASWEDIKCKKDSSGGLTLDLESANLKYGSTQIDTLTWLPAHTVVHELAHLFPAQENGRIDWITDCYYGPYAAEFMAIHAPDAAIANADNYAWFSTAQYLNTLCGAPDQLYYRAWNDKWFWLQSQTFKSQLLEFEKNKATIKKLKAQVKVSVEGAEEKLEETQKKYRLFDYDEEICSMNLDWDEVQEIMSKRPSQPE